MERCDRSSYKRNLFSMISGWRPSSSSLPQWGFEPSRGALNCEIALRAFLSIAAAVGAISDEVLFMRDGYVPFDPLKLRSHRRAQRTAVPPP